MCEVEEEFVTELNEKATILRKNLVHEFDSFLQKHLDEFIKDVANPKLAQNTEIRKSKKISPKVFRNRESIITLLLRLKQFETVFNILVGLCLLLTANYFFSPDATSIVWEMIDSVSHKSFALKFEACMTGITLFVVFFMTRLWVLSRPLGAKLDTLDYFFGLLYLVYMICFWVIPPIVILSVSPSFVTRCILVFEQVRMVLKAHSFVRHTVAHVLQLDSEGAGTSSVPSFSSYLYFFFAPCLVFRQEYPRSRNLRVNWCMALYYLAQFVGCVVISYCLFHHYCITYLRQFRDSDKTIHNFCILFARMTLPSTFSLFLVFYSFQHCWLNMFAELLRFGDRHFYNSWWQSVHFSEFFRTWNMVIHDWLYSHIYRDLCLVFGMKARVLWKLAVFVFSAIVHEYVIFISLGFYYPILLFLFLGIGTFLAFLPPIKIFSQFTNVLFILSLTFGFSIFYIFYTLEYYTRMTCSPHNISFWDSFLPFIAYCRISV